MEDGDGLACYSFREALAAGVASGDVTQHISYAEAYKYAGTLLSNDNGLFELARMTVNGS